ncbi:MAG: hypothetical protein ABIA62_00990, partial [Candidatus Woesearchaeota archaeon]
MLIFAVILSVLFSVVVTGAGTCKHQPAPEGFSKPGYSVISCTYSDGTTEYTPTYLIRSTDSAFLDSTTADLEKGTVTTTVTGGKAILVPPSGQQKEMLIGATSAYDLSANTAPPVSDTNIAVGTSGHSEVWEVTAASYGSDSARGGMPSLADQSGAAAGKYDYSRETQINDKPAIIFKDRSGQEFAVIPGDTDFVYSTKGEIIGRQTTGGGVLISPNHPVSQDQLTLTYVDPVSGDNKALSYTGSTIGSDGKDRHSYRRADGVTVLIDPESGEVTDFRSNDQQQFKPVSSADVGKTAGRISTAYGTVSKGTISSPAGEEVQVPQLGGTAIPVARQTGGISAGSSGGSEVISDTLSASVQSNYVPANNEVVPFKVGEQDRTYTRVGTDSYGRAVYQRTDVTNGAFVTVTEKGLVQHADMNTDIGKLPDTARFAILTGDLNTRIQANEAQITEARKNPLPQVVRGPELTIQSNPSMVQIQNSIGGAVEPLATISYASGENTINHRLVGTKVIDGKTYYMYEQGPSILANGKQSELIGSLTTYVDPATGEVAYYEQDTGLGTVSGLTRITDSNRGSAAININSALKSRQGPPPQTVSLPVDWAPKSAPNTLSLGANAAANEYVITSPAPNTVEYLEPPRTGSNVRQKIVSTTDPTTGDVKVERFVCTSNCGNPATADWGEPLSASSKDVAAIKANSKQVLAERVGASEAVQKAVMASGTVTPPPRPPTEDISAAPVTEIAGVTEVTAPQMVTPLLRVDTITVAADKKSKDTITTLPANYQSPTEKTPVKIGEVVYTADVQPDGSIVYTHTAKVGDKTTVTRITKKDDTITKEVCSNNCDAADAAKQEWSKPLSPTPVELTNVNEASTLITQERDAELKKQQAALAASADSPREFNRRDEPVVIKDAEGKDVEFDAQYSYNEGEETWYVNYVAGVAVTEDGTRRDLTQDEWGALISNEKKGVGYNVIAVGDSTYHMLGNDEDGTPIYAKDGEELGEDGKPVPHRLTDIETVAQETNTDITRSGRRMIAVQSGISASELDAFYTPVGGSMDTSAGYQITGRVMGPDNKPLKDSNGNDMIGITDDNGNNFVMSIDDNVLYGPDGKTHVGEINQDGTISRDWTGAGGVFAGAAGA